MQNIPEYVECNDIENKYKISDKITVNANSPFTVFPNPSSETISITVPTTDGMTFKIIDNLGETIEIVKIIPNTSSINIDISQYPIGIYILKDDSGVQQIQKFIKIK